jgi:predicted Zn-dependent peptidase
VILQEIGQAADTPDDIIFDWLQEEAFPGQPLGRTILGPAERVRGVHPWRFRPVRGRALRAE